MSKPRNIFIKTLINNSKSQVLDIAFSEWVFSDVICSDNSDFSPKCHLCGATIYNQNLLLVNVKTMKELLIGSECAKRFKSSTKDKLSLDRILSENQLRRKLIDQYQLICNQGNPDRDLFKSFRKNLFVYLKSKNKVHLVRTIEGAVKILTEILDKNVYTNKEIKRINLIISEPRKALAIHVMTPRIQTKKVDKYGIVISH
ncbi:hypothetical protein CEF21_05110 [Bacillus sp. FJAT-42376]|uniref:hypothetical protein n=1 Tax=Bacillus sp. FJAT-42376 TaxID=2014076 RepID=UPI000F4F42B9|nr:hypothetical protein [Bacillus sp. FJAT-42376]AZB41728.1 hypothetical protein CEF21_05110 [Bacillus sp. FJAT-42376]